MGEHNNNLYVSVRDKASDIHDQCDRVAQWRDKEANKDQEVDDADKQLVESIEPFLHKVRGSFSESSLRKISYTIYLTDPCRMLADSSKKNKLLHLNMLAFSLNILTLLLVITLISN